MPVIRLDLIGLTTQPEILHIMTLALHSMADVVECSFLGDGFWVVGVRSVEAIFFIQQCLNIFRVHVKPVLVFASCGTEGLGSSGVHQIS